MSDSVSNPKSTPMPASSIPSFLLALQGMWMLTWRQQFSWSKLSQATLGLFALPALILIAVTTPAVWRERNIVRMGPPAAYLTQIESRLERNRAGLDTDQRAQLLAVITEEFASAEQTSAKGIDENKTLDPWALRERCHDTIRNRASDFLDEKQLNHLRTVQKRFRGPRPAGDEAVWNRSTPFFRLLLELYFFIALPFHCVRACGAVVRDELEAGTLPFLTTRPITRAQLILAKYGAVVAWVQIWLLIQTLLIFAAGLIREIPGVLSIIPLFLAVQFVCVFVWAALGLCLGLFTAKYMGLALLYGGIVEQGLGRIPSNINALSMLRHVKILLSHDSTLQAIYQWPVGSSANAVFSMAIGAAVFLGGAALLFTFREYLSANEAHK